MRCEAEPSPSPLLSPTTSALMARLPAMGSTHASREVETSSSISAINRFILSDLTRWSTLFGNSISRPLSPFAVMNSTSYPQTSVLGSLGRPRSLLGKNGLRGEEKKGFIMSPDLAKEKERDEDTGERAISPAGTSPRHRHELLLSRLSPSASPNSPSLPLPNRPKNSFLTHNSILSSTSVSSTISSSARALLHVHSWTSLRSEKG